MSCRAICDCLDTKDAPIQIDEATIHKNAKEGTVSVVKMLKDMEDARDRFGWQADSLKVLADVVRDRYQQLITAVKSVLSKSGQCEISSKSPEVMRVFEITLEEIPSAIKELFRKCQSVAEIKMAEKKLYSTIQDVDKEARSMAESYNMYMSKIESLSETHMPRSQVLEAALVEKLVDLLSEYGNYLSLLPPLLKGGVVNELFAGLKDIASHTSSLSTVVEEICQQMDITLAPDTEKNGELSPENTQNRPRKNSLAEEKRAEVQSCSEMIRTTSVQMMRDAKEYISSKFTRWDLMLGMLKNSALLISFGGTLVAALRI